MHFRVKATRLPEGKRVFVIGSYDAVGSWVVKDAIALECSVSPIWTASIKVKKNAIPFEYKYIVSDSDKQNVRLYQPTAFLLLSGCVY